MDRRRTEWILSLTLALSATGIAEWFALQLSQLRPLKYDEYVFAADRVLGNPSFRLGKLAASHLWIHALVGVSYGLLSFAMVATIAAYLYLVSEKEAISTVRIFALDLFAAVPLYLLFPVCGPQFAFPSFPAVPEEVAAHPILIDAAPNGIPSVHMATAILILILLWRWRVGRIVGIMFLLLMGFATLASGQHYAIDLVCAIPYSAFIWILAGDSKVAHMRKANAPPPEANGAATVI